ncbi:MAG: 6-phosphogluconolactonase [Cyanobacteria bacterium SZAS TMP-1]|nr:6-phosphogluconolactonase [Cyanobacteria bacterium SZAS TMP-1]
MAPNVSVSRTGSPEEMAQAGARRFAQICENTITKKGLVSVALSGGNTPRRLYEILASPPYASRLDWSKITILLGDERLVPIDHKDSNYLMARQTLLDHVPVNERNVLRVYTELSTPGASALDYELTIRKHLKTKEGAIPVIDLILLGMGPDGHTASLFPGTAALKEKDRIVAANYVPKFDSWRITLTTPILRNAQNIIFMVTGTDKAAALKEVLEGQLDENLYPAQLIRGMPGKVEWLVDNEISAGLRQSLSNSSTGVRR